jgi:hypothetical protein
VNCTTAHNMMIEAAHLARLVGIFQSKYGKDAVLEEVDQTLYTQLIERQQKIALMLDQPVTPYPRFGKWWERHTVMDGAMAQELICEVGHLIAYCAKLNATSTKSSDSRIVHNAQCVIAGILHPDSFSIKTQRQTA